jgi:hypothetical protein
MMKVFMTLVLLVATQGILAQQKAFYVYQVDALEKVLKDRRYFRDDVDTICVARGETATIQLVVKARTDLASLGVSATTSLKGSVCETGLVDYVKVNRKYNPPSMDLLRTPSDYFPDPILTDTTFNLEQGEVQPVWISLKVPLNAAPGLYKGTAQLTALAGGAKQHQKKDFYIRVYPVTVASTSLLITNWCSLFPDNLAYMNGGVPVASYTPLYWECVQKIAATMAAHGQNVNRVYPIWLTKYKLQGDRYSFDFSYFDKEVEIFEKAGAMERIEGGHLAWRSGKWDEPFFVEIPVADTGINKQLMPGVPPVTLGEGLRLVKLPLDDPRVKNFYDQFFPAFRAHLEKKGWLHKYMQHIADEPTAKNAESYQAISAYVRKYMPGVKIVDAVLTSKELAGAIDTWVPILDVLHKDHRFYSDLQKAGKEIWFYTCVGPRGNYANRFIELPLIQTRYLHWINFKYELTGYLHWGLNFWSGFKNPFGEASRNRGRLPAGDCFIIYPGYRKLYSSIRFEAMRDGIYDYELLKMLEKKDAAKAKQFANEIVRNFADYDGSISYFRETRKKMLELLSN